MLDKLIQQMLHAKRQANLDRKAGYPGPRAWDNIHDEIHQQVKDLLYLDGLIGAVVW